MNYNKNSLLNMKICNVCKNDYSYFLNKKYVTGIALGYKIYNGFCLFKKCITVFVIKKLPLNNLRKEDTIPNFYKGILTDVVENGIFKFNSLTSRIRPVINGYSISNESSNGIGTCGCLVYDKYLYILSCTHVLTLNNTGPKESIILQPALRDKGTIKKDVIGHLSRFIPIKYIEGSKTPENLVDCGLCKVINRSFVSSTIAFIGIPKDLSFARLNEDVQKVGRTTELTFGKITSLYGSILVVNQQGKEALFKDQIITTKMSDDGDSGALLLNNNNYSIGLLMGGSHERSVYNSLDDVLKALNVKLVTK